MQEYFKDMNNYLFEIGDAGAMPLEWTFQRILNGTYIYRVQSNPRTRKNYKHSEETKEKMRMIWAKRKEEKLKNNLDEESITTE